jgi:hypothetical protein
MTTFGVVVLLGAGLALYLCTPTADGTVMTPGQATGVGFTGAVATFALTLVVTLVTTLTGLSHVTPQQLAGDERPGGVSRWSAITARARMAGVFAIYGFLGFALGGTVAAAISLLGRSG